MKNKINNLIKSYELSKLTIDSVINPLEIIKLFEDKGLNYVLVGGHMLAYYTNNPRATVDVDFIIAEADFNKARKIITANYSKLRQNDKTHHVTFDCIHSKDSEAERIDLIKDGFPLFKQVLKALSKKSGKLKIPNIEAAIVLKFAASISPNRAEDDKLIDQADLINLIKTKAKLNEKTLVLLAECIYTGGGNELLQVINDIKQGNAISL